jgi:formylglycine-generating enzyme required for sulfatase activity
VQRGSGCGDIDLPNTSIRTGVGPCPWYEAEAFCIWDGGFLPTEAEWNYAAAGGLEQRVYPWSSPARDLTVDWNYAHARW